MPVINQEVFVEITTNPSHRLSRKLLQQVSSAGRSSIPGQLYDSFMDPLPEFIPNPVDREAALAMLATLKQNALDMGRLRGKFLRPHEFDTFSYLDRSKPWWGFEFETGWQSWAARSRAIEAAWDIGRNGVSFDGEGEGAYISEITFAPDVVDSYFDGSAPAIQFMQYMNDHQEDIYFNPLDDGCGTHLNFSLPEGIPASLAAILNNSFALLPMVDVDGINPRRTWVGRSNIYGGFSKQGGVSNPYIEGKIFRTTYTMEQFQKYLEVSKAVMKIVEAVVAGASDISTYHTGVINLLEMFKDPSVDPVFVVNRNLVGSSRNAWVSGRVRTSQQYSYNDYDYDSSAGSPFDN